MSLLDKAKAQFAEKLRSVGEYHVEQWGETIYYRPMTLKERNEIAARSKDGELDVIVETLIQRARNASGEKVFTRANKPELMREVDPDIMSDIVIAMSRYDRELISGN